MSQFTEWLGTIPEELMDSFEEWLEERLEVLEEDQREALIQEYML